jgi:hypothetical protein
MLLRTFGGFFTPGECCQPRLVAFFAPKNRSNARSRHLITAFYKTNRATRQAREKSLFRARFSPVLRAKTEL